MFITVDRDQFLRALAIVEHAIGRSPAFPVLGYVRITANDKTVELAATNLEISITTNLAAHIHTPGTISVPFRTLGGLLHNLSSASCGLKAHQQMLEIVAAAQHAKIQAGRPDEFPAIPTIKTKTTVRFPNARNIAQHLDAVLPAVASSDVRPELGGVLLEATEEEAVLVATDTFRLALRSVQDTEAKEPKVAILPKRTAEVLAKLMREAKYIDAHLSVTQALFTDGTTNITSRLIEGSFPDFASILPKQEAAAIRLSRDEFLQELHAASLFTSRLNDTLLTIQPQKGSMLIAAQNPDVGEYQTELKGTARGQKITLAFNYRYLIDGLVGFPDQKQIDVVFVGEGKPGLFRPAGSTNERNLYLVMPIRTNA